MILIIHCPGHRAKHLVETRDAVQAGADDFVLHGTARQAPQGLVMLVDVVDERSGVHDDELNRFVATRRDEVFTVGGERRPENPTPTAPITTTNSTLSIITIL